MIPTKNFIQPNWPILLTLISWKLILFLALVDVVEGIVQSSGISVSELAWLEEFQPPENFVVRRGVYKGPVIRT